LKYINSLSVIIPVYNEKCGLHDALREVLGELYHHGIEFEIIVIDDGSTDGSEVTLGKWSVEEARVKILHHERNQGKGSALRTGLSYASLEWVLFIDADRQIPSSTLNRFDIAADGAEVLIGCRHDKQYTLFRRAVSAIYRVMACILFGLRVKDIGCPFKLIQRDLLRSLNLSASGFGFDVELLWRISQTGTPIIEIPVVSLPRKTGKSKITFQSIAECVRELLLLRLHG
jgi:glycosyltransferase involved in cell wall biosynthesis